MCFSAEVSYTAAASLAIIGGVTLKNFSARNYLLLAAVPLLFAMQQLSEGILWTQLSNGEQNSFISLLTQKIYLVFAFLVWPLWIPLSLAVIETIAWRRAVIFFILSCGVVMTALNIYTAMGQHIGVNIINHSIQYTGHSPNEQLAYPLIVLLPLFISSLNRIWVYGLLTVLAYGVTVYFYEETFISVWCFFASIVSLSLFKVLKDNARVEAEAKVRR